MIIVGETFAELYKKSLHEIIKCPEFKTAPRGMAIKENINAQLVLLDPTSNLFKNPVRSVPKEYLAKELILYFLCSNSIKDFGAAAPFWNTIANEDGTVNSAYGKLIFDNFDRLNITQWNWAIQSLIKDKDSRQAIMHYNRPVHQVDGIKDFPCTISNQFFIRDDELHMTTYMRSNDIFFGLTFDLPFFTKLMELMHQELLWHYRDLKIGTYTHFDGSLHAYERDFDILENMLNHDFEPDGIPYSAESPIKNKELESILRGKKYEGYDTFLVWLSDILAK